MTGADRRLDTERLVIRGFTQEDWPAIQELARDINSSDTAKYDMPWPIQEEVCKGMADYFAKSILPTRQHGVDYRWVVG